MIPRGWWNRERPPDDRTHREAAKARLARIKVAQAKRRTDDLVRELNVLEAVFLHDDDARDERDEGAERAE